MRPRAFTLVELLVVISILALLVALIFVVSGSTRRHAQTIACRANLHGLLLSLQTYDSEYQSLPYGWDFKMGAMPPGGYVGDGRWDLPGWWWFHFADVIRSRSRTATKPLQCPAKQLDDPLLQNDPLCGNYGANRALCKTVPSWTRALYKKGFIGRPLSLGSLPQPGSTLLLADSGYTLLCWWNATADPPVKFDPYYIEDSSYVPGLKINKGKTLRTGQWADAVSGRHPNQTVNVGFADGHVDLLPARDLLVEKTVECQYTNTRLWLGR